MLTYCLKSKKDAENVNSEVMNKYGRPMLSSKSPVCGIK